MNHLNPFESKTFELYITEREIATYERRKGVEDAIVLFAIQKFRKVYGQLEKKKEQIFTAIPGWTWRCSIPEEQCVREFFVLEEVIKKVNESIDHKKIETDLKKAKEKLDYLEQNIKI